jgi:hypothetical protein
MAQATLRRENIPEHPFLKADQPPLGLPEPKLLLGTRIFSLLALIGMLIGIAYGTATGYRLLHDSFVAPIIFSPDNDLVIQNKLNLNRLLAERQRLLTRITESAAAMEIDDQGLARLLDFKRSVSRTLAWSKALTTKQATVSAQELERLAQQKAVIESMTTDQQQYVDEMKRNLEAGLIRKSDLERHQSSLDQLRIAWLQNARDQLTAEVQLETASLTQAVLDKRSDTPGLVTPEMAAQRDQVVRIELDLLKLQAERQAKLAQKRTDEDELVKLDELIADMKRRPIFRAIEVSQNVAFVPYNQLEGIHAGSTVYDCKLWSVFACRRVGRIAELLPGEVATQDPWGTPSRGQYAILELDDASAARSKALRVREQSSDLVTQASGEISRRLRQLGASADLLRVAAAGWVGRLSTGR